MVIWQYQYRPSTKRRFIWVDEPCPSMLQPSQDSKDTMYYHVTRRAPACQPKDRQQIAILSICKVSIETKPFNFSNQAHSSIDNCRCQKLIIAEESVRKLSRLVAAIIYLHDRLLLCECRISEPSCLRQASKRVIYAVVAECSGVVHLEIAYAEYAPRTKMHSPNCMNC